MYLASLSRGALTVFISTSPIAMDLSCTIQDCKFAQSATVITAGIATCSVEKLCNIIQLNHIGSYYTIHRGKNVVI